MFYFGISFYLQKGGKGSAESVCLPLAWVSPSVKHHTLPGTFAKTKKVTVAHDC